MSEDNTKDQEIGKDIQWGAKIEELSAQVEAMRGVMKKEANRPNNRRGQNNGPNRSDLICWSCGQKGHFARTCWQKQGRGRGSIGGTGRGISGNGPPAWPSTNRRGRGRGTRVRELYEDEEVDEENDVWSEN